MNAFRGSSCGSGGLLVDPLADVAGVTPHLLHTHPPTFLDNPSLELLDDLEVGRSGIPTLDRKYEELSWPLRESVGRAVAIDELITGCVDTNDVRGVLAPCLVRGRSNAPEPVMVSCDGRDFRV